MVILYTLDGSEPDPDNLDGSTFQYRNSWRQSPQDPDEGFLEHTFRTHVYTEALLLSDRTSAENHLSNFSSTWHYHPSYFPDGPVQKGHTIRAAVYKNGVLSPIISRTFYVQTS